MDTAFLLVHGLLIMDFDFILKYRCRLFSSVNPRHYLTITTYYVICQVSLVERRQVMARKTRQVETRMIAEYVLAEYGKFPHILKQPLGKVPEYLMAEEGYTKAVRMMRPTRPEVDAVVMHPRWLIIIEAKVWHIVDGAAKLPFYKSLVPFTPELKEYKDKTILMELVVPWTNDNLEIMCRDHDIRLKVYRPDWLAEVANRVTEYSTREYRLAREEKLRNRELLGLE